ncbi:Carboxypeptidase regulatory-like domain-containing protein [Pseudoxanthomonas sp. GM95]|uniref:TonB-dependent receptor n=1 Tax=Pseudoxanthomonas sp. GM95 TaxID=1881043 RepID=UPI0008B43F3D|nr:TonB-dependent receptor [Pseudoxanthomonas sp. GM95]SEK68561.1 Carboxypeptidase regulatory-like domain-containing protein [Pseudoxanthomonas sp. GM95]
MTQHRRIRTSKLALGLLAALAAAPAMAQTTSAGVGGQVIGAGGAPVAGAEVTITHVESGTVSRATTDAAGRYTARGLRVGGPYTVTVTKPGEGTKTEDGVYLDLNKVNTVDAALTGDVTNLGSVQAIGYSGGSEVFSATKMGSGTSVNQAKIEALPSINGNIQDYMRLDPRVTFVDRASGTISAGGQNPRFNSINIDGISASDTFGLEGNNMATRRQPVSMEAIEAIDINLSNYDVSIAGATGATVNAVTKSGTNEFHGSVYGTYRDGDWFGDNPEGDKFNGFTKEKTYGATIGGPIVKDKLFFFANYEKFEQQAPGVDLASTALGDPTADFDMNDVTRAQQISQDVWGFNAGGLASNGNTDLEEYALKLDWNISDAHRASVRYSKLDQSKLRINGASSSSQASLSSYWYQHEKSVESYVGQLFSDWSDNFSTELKASFRDYSAIRVVPTTAPSVAIYFGGDDITSPTGDVLYLGTETNSQNNILKTKTWNYTASGTWTVGDHDLKFGADYSTNDIYNYYGANSWGVYRFVGLDNYQAGIWSQYDLSAEVTPGSIAADYKNDNLGLFVQDTWYVSPNLTLNFGVRGDRPGVSPKPAYNAAASDYFGYNNSKVFESKFLIQPRFGFNYTFDSERPTQLRGGVGLFQGDAPQVWISNSYSTTGYNYTSYTQYVDDNGTVPFGFNPDGMNPTVPTVAGSATQNVNFVANDFELPSVWKANLAFDHELPWYGIVASAELLVTKVKNGLFYQSLNIGDVEVPGEGPVPTFVDNYGRNQYYDSTKQGNAWASSNARAGRNRDYNNVFLIDNTDKGKTQQFTAMLSKPWSANSDWSWDLGYTYTHATEVGPLTSSTASSGWGYQYGFNANEEVETTARYEIKDRLSGSLNWKHKFFGDYETSVGLVYEGRSGRPYSYVYVNDANGDSRTANDLFYVPKGQGDVLFGTLTTGGEFTASPQMEKAFFDWLQANPDLAKYAGKTAPANGFRTGWINTFDVRVSQQLPGFMKGHKSEIWLDIQNVGNLINKDWGHIYDYGFYADSRVATLQGIYDGKYVYNFRSADQPTVANADADGFDVGVSQWSLQVGFRYQF